MLFVLSIKHQLVVWDADETESWGIGGKYVNGGEVECGVSLFEFQFAERVEIVSTISICFDIERQTEAVPLGHRIYFTGVFHSIGLYGLALSQ